MSEGIEILGETQAVALDARINWSALNADCPPIGIGVRGIPVIVATTAVGAPCK